MKPDPNLTPEASSPKCSLYPHPGAHEEAPQGDRGERRRQREALLARRRRGRRGGRVRERHAGGHHEAVRAQEVERHAVLPPDGRARGHPRHQPAHVVRQEAKKCGPPLLLALAAAVRVRGHEHDLQGVLRRGEVHARAGLRSVQPHRGWQRQLDQEEQRGDHRGHHGGARAAIPDGDRRRWLQGEAAQVCRCQGAALRVRRHPGPQQVPPVAGDAHPELLALWLLHVPEVPRFHGGRHPRGQACR
mmetsp:Transcript_15343/g.46161  ORF Transcript_15343/g.46161 Transcript_15343/m.46161 type:complete len:246 (+) Transcript_15343:1246-1983(+)